MCVSELYKKFIENVAAEYQSIAKREYDAAYCLGYHKGYGDARVGKKSSCGENCQIKEPCDFKQETINYPSISDEQYIEDLRQKVKENKTWEDITDPDKWLREMRGSDNVSSKAKEE